MALACSTAVVTVSPSSRGVAGGRVSGSPSSLLVRENGLRSPRKLCSRASYGIPGYGAPRPYQTPGAGFHNNGRPAETIANPTSGDNRSRLGLPNYGAPADYSTPVQYQTPKSYRAPQAYGSGSTTTELGQEGLTPEDVQEPALDGGDVNGGGGRGDENGGSGGGRGDGSGSGGDDGAKKKQSGLSMSQKLTLAYAILVGVGGIMGFAKSGSSKSLMAGGGSASILYYVFLNLPSNPVLASTIGLGISGLLLFIMGSRYMESGKVFPAGVVSLFSLVMAGGYIHGILRTTHT